VNLLPLDLLPHYEPLFMMQALMKNMISPNRGGYFDCRGSFQTVVDSYYWVWCHCFDAVYVDSAFSIIIIKKLTNKCGAHQ